MIFILDLVISYKDTMLVFRWEQTVLFFFFCYERDFMKSLSDDNQVEIIEAFNSTSRYLDDLPNIDNPHSKEWLTKFATKNENRWKKEKFLHKLILNTEFL